MNEIEKKVIHIIEQIRPFLQNDGGDLKFIRIEDNVVYVKMLGGCQGCPMMGITLKNVIEESIKNEIPEIAEVRNVE